MPSLTRRPTPAWLVPAAVVLIAVSVPWFAINAEQTYSAAFALASAHAPTLRVDINSLNRGGRASAMGVAGLVLLGLAWWFGLLRQSNRVVWIAILVLSASAGAAFYAVPRWSLSGRLEGLGYQRCAALDRLGGGQRYMSVYHAWTLPGACPPQH